MLEVARKDRHTRVSRLVKGIVVCVVVMDECRGKRWRGKWTADTIDKEPCRQALSLPRVGIDSPESDGNPRVVDGIYGHAPRINKMTRTRKGLIVHLRTNQ